MLDLYSYMSQLIDEWRAYRFSAVLYVCGSFMILLNDDFQTSIERSN